MTHFKALLLCAGVACSIPAGARAGQYFQDFSSASVGATNWGDGSTFSSTAGSNFAGVADATLKELRFTVAGLPETRSALLLPDLDPSAIIHAFSAKWSAMIAGNFPGAGDGFSFNFGPLSGLNLISTNFNQEGGYGAGLTFSVQTFGANSPGFYLRANGVTLASVTNLPGAVWGTNSIAHRFFEVDWHHQNGLTVRMDGVAIFSNIPVTGFAPRRGNRFVWAARTGAFAQTLQLDNLVVMTGGLLSPAPNTEPTFGSVTNIGNQPFRAFDGDYESYWSANMPTGFVGTSLSAATNVRVYALTAARWLPVTVGSAIDPRNWTLEGSTNGTTWISCGSATGFFTNRPDTRCWIATNATAFSSYRLNIQSNYSGSGSVAVGELRLYSFTPVTAPEFLNIPQANLTGLGSSDAAWGDFNNDDLLDFAILGQNGGVGQLQVWQNSGNGRFVQISNTNFPPLAFGGVAWGDYDNDGDLDLAAAGRDSVTTYGGLYVFRNDGGASFVRNTAATFAPLLGGPVVWFDYNRDGRLDLLCAGRLFDANGFQGFVTYLYHNNGNGTFTRIASTGLPSVDDGHVAIADFDNDGLEDILMAGTLDLSFTGTRIYRNLGTGTFVEQPSPGWPAFDEAGASWGDVNNDTNFDFAVSGRTGFPSIMDQVAIWTNHPVGDNFSNLLTLPSSIMGGQGSYTAFGDYNADGFADLLVSGATGLRLGLLRNNGNSTFSTNVNLTAPRSSNGAQAWGDFDNDGMLDFITTGFLSDSTPYTALFQQNGVATNVPPSPVPSMGIFWISNTSVRLGWLDPFSGTTPPGGLTFNMRIGTTPGGIDILSPMASTNGVRRIAAHGNLSKKRDIILKLPLGTYYASVQAVDAAYAGGPFAFNTMFSITNGASAPGVTTTAATVTGPFSATLNAVITPNGIPTTAWFQWGLTTNYGNQTSAQGVGNFVSGTTAFSNLAGLAAATLYHYRAVASNSLGLVFGSNLTFTTLGAVPSATTLAATAITTNSATLNGSANPNYLTTTVWFAWGATTNFGNITAPQSAGNGNASVPASQALAGLQPGATYYFALVASNLLGSSTGSILSFQTPFLTRLDAWRHHYFGTTNNSGDGADTADPEGDGNANLLEFASGGNPTNNGPSPLIDLAFSNATPRVIYLRDTNANGIVSWHVESAPTPFDTWSNRSGSLQVIATSAAIETVRFDAHLPVPTNESFRLRVTRP